MSAPDPHELHDQLSQAAHSMVAPPEQLHEDLVKSIMDVVGKMIDARVPKLATVTGQDGGKITVQMDDEDTPRQLGFSRKNGQRYNNGDRVVAMPTGSGDDHVILGTITSAQGNGEQAVGNPDLYDRSVDNNKLAKSSVQAEHMTPNSVLNDHVGTGEINGSASGKKNNIAGGSIGKGDLDNSSVVKPLEGAVQAADLPGDAKNKPGQLATKSDIPDISPLAKAKDINDNIVNVLDNKQITISGKVDDKGAFSVKFNLPSLKSV